MEKIKIQAIPTDNNDINIRLKSGQFSGVIFKYGNISSDEIDEGILNYDYEIIDSNGFDDLINNKLFQKELDNLITQLLIESCENYQKNKCQ